MSQHILAIDQGTTGTTVLVIEVGSSGEGSSIGRTVGRAELTRLSGVYPVRTATKP